MNGGLKERIGKRRRFQSLEQEVFLTLLHASDALARGFDELFGSAGLSSTQYNVLRILRGAGPDGLACSEIAHRMITRDPDMTRLLDRLEKQHLIARHRDVHDRRVVKTRIAPEGLMMLADLDVPVQRLHAKQFSHMTRRQLQELLALLREVLP